MSSSGTAAEELEPTPLWKKARDKLRERDETRKLVDSYERELVRQILQGMSRFLDRLLEILFS